MSRLAPLILLALQACATAPASPPADARVPRLREVERMESGWAMYELLLTVGVQDSAEMNRNARVRIRNLACAPAAGSRAACGYEASQCLAGELSAGQDGWCRRTAHFMPATEVPPLLWSARGWTLERAPR